MEPYLFFHAIEKSRAYVAGLKRGLSWKQYEARAAVLDNVNFDCQINSQGLCKRYQRHPNDGKNCCSRCAASGGYLKSIKPGTANEYAQLWDDYNGFWQEGKGCVLPRKMRSYTCLTYNCHPKGDFGGATAFNLYEFMRSGKTKLIQIALVNVEMTISNQKFKDK